MSRRQLSWEKCLPPNLKTWVWSLGPTWRKERPNSSKLSSDLSMDVMACTHTYIYPPIQTYKINRCDKNVIPLSQTPAVTYKSVPDTMLTISPSLPVSSTTPSLLWSIHTGFLLLFFSMGNAFPLCCVYYWNNQKVLHLECCKAGSFLPKPSSNIILHRHTRSLTLGAILSLEPLPHDNRTHRHYNLKYKLIN